MTFILAGQIKPLQEEIAELQSKLKEAQARLYEINEKVCRAEEPVSRIKSLARDLTKMFKDDPGILAEIKDHILNAFNSQDDTIIEKQEVSPVVANAKTDEEIVTKDVVEDVQQEGPEPVKNIANYALAVENKVKDDKVLLTNKKTANKWTPSSKNSSTVGTIQRENKVNKLANEGLKKIDKCTNTVELRKFYEELFDKHPDVAESVKAKILTSLTSSARAWDKYKTIDEIIPPGTPLEHDNGNYKVDILYYVRPCADNKEDNQKYCEARTSKGNPKVVSFPADGSNTRLAINEKPPSPKLQKQIEDISANKAVQKDINMILQSIDIVEEINLVKDQPVPF